MYLLIRERLQVMGIDPELAGSLRLAKEAAAELAAIPDTRQLKIADEKIIRANHGGGSDGARQVER